MAGDAQARLQRRRRVSMVATMSGAAVVIFVALTARQHTRERERRAHEEELRTDVAAIRAAIHAYNAKHQANPASLQDLVRDGDLRAIPVDPITKSSTTWRPTLQETVRIDDFQTGAARPQATIADVHSGATGSDSNGKPFADY